MISPGNTIGILGGGQLGRMLAHAAERLGYRVHIYEPTPDCPAGEVAASETNAPYDDTTTLTSFARNCAVVTYEFENIPSAPLSAIENTTTLHPRRGLLEICQNRLREKTWLRTQGFPHAPFVEVPPHGDLAAAIHTLGFPCVIKTADFGYDGKGQLKVTDQASLAHAVQAFSGQPAVVEKFISFACECSVLVARSSTGEVRSFPVVENVHTRHILDFTLAPARLPPELQARATTLADNIATRIDLVGLLAVELFVGSDGTLLVNELAPRPHNSGHWTLDACVTSQFEQHIRAICGLPLGDVSLTRPAATMVNLLGDDWRWQADRLLGDPDWNTLLTEADVHLHLYGKKDPRRARKMGHFTVSAPTPSAALSRAQSLQARLRAPTPAS